MKLKALNVFMLSIACGGLSPIATAEVVSPDITWPGGGGNNGGDEVTVETGDASYGTAKFSGFVSGFASNGALIVTGSGGAREEAAYTAELNVNANGTFDAKKAVVLESHVYDEAEDQVGELYSNVDWVVEQIVFAGDLSAEQQNELQASILLEDVLTGTEIDGAQGKIANADLSSGENSVHLRVSNIKPLKTELDVGSFLTVGVNMVATAL